MASVNTPSSGPSNSLPATDQRHAQQKPEDASSPGWAARSLLSLFRLADFNLEAALHYGEIGAALAMNGQVIGPLDLLIAAQARSSAQPLSLPTPLSSSASKDLKPSLGNDLWPLIAALLCGRCALRV
jgi:hypothetical protein